MKVKKVIYRLGKDALKSVEDNTDSASGLAIEDWTSKGRAKSLVFINTEPPSLMFMAPVVHKKVVYAQTLPQPSSLFLLQAKEFTRSSLNIADKFADNVTVKMSSNGVGQFNVVSEEVYYAFLSYRISALTSLVMFVESFVNSIIPEEFEIENKQGNVDGKHRVERFWSLKSKLKTVVPKIRTIEDEKEYRSAQDRFLKINELRNDFIHLKSTRDSKNMDPFIIHFEELINLDLERSIEQTEKLVSIIDSKYFE